LKKIGITDQLSFIIIGIFYGLTFLFGYTYGVGKDNSKAYSTLDQKKLIHIVLIEFKPSLTDIQLQQVSDAAYRLQQIKGVQSLNFGVNTSPEGLNKGYTHSLTMKFSDAYSRDSIYLPHPIHQKFVELFVPLTNTVLVYDYWE
jgi:hypothetical protein